MNKLKFLLFKYSIKRFVPLTSGAPRKRLSKPVLLIFGIALVFAIIGFIDLKVNASELYTANITFGLCQYDNGSFSGIYAGIGGTYTLTSNNPIYVYWYNPYEVPTNASGQEGQVFINDLPHSGQNLAFLPGRAAPQCGQG